MAPTTTSLEATTCCLACGRTLAVTGPRGKLDEGETAPDLSWQVCSTTCYHTHATRVLATATLAN
ncbi:MAG TPA: hypothetical protein VNZ52_02975 [Candidatus Thermoplasmatota archaeon]|nr:hypothetical protein [Candidatus Thermoplasmatota archaeon]